MRTKSIFTAVAIAIAASVCHAVNYVSWVWQPDLGNGYYKNPVINADYSDPDVICVDGTYYMTASSFCNVPGLPILRSYDLVNWEIVNHAAKKLLPVEFYNKPQHGKGVWAPAMRYHDGTYYIYWGDPDHGVFMVKTTDPLGEWEAPVLVQEGKGIIDTCPLWDEDGKAYLVNGWAKSRAGLNALLTVTEMSPDGTRLIGEPVAVYDGLKDGNHTIEGPKFYKRNGYYYILAPAGGVATGWQVALRSKSPYGPYEVKTVMAQGKSDINGPHQGAWVHTPQGEDWFLHFQDKGVIGRVLHLQPMAWKNDWPVIGSDKDGKGCGEPVDRYLKPSTGTVKHPIQNPVESDEFDSVTLGKQWQWMANYQLPFGFASPQGYYRLYGHNLSENYINMFEVPNILTQKFPNESFTATAKVTVSATQDGQKSGVIVFGRDYAAIAVEKTGNNFTIKFIECYGADKDKPETEIAVATLPATRINGEGQRATQDLDLWLRVKVDNEEYCQFEYSTDGKRFKPCGTIFKAREGYWTGARIGFFSVQPPKNNRGWIDIDYFRISPY